MTSNKDTTQTVPTHVGFILDGNRRWAQSKGLPTMEGHRAGYENLHDIAKYAFDRGVKYVTAYVFSTENWNRSAEEVAYLMKLAPLVFNKYIKQIEKNKIRIHWLGTRQQLSANMLKIIDEAVESTKSYDDGHLCLCFNYGARTELVEAAQKLAAQHYSAEDITEALFRQSLYEPSVPDIDLVIRTSGEQRMSNFNLWRAAYAELYFVDKHWPAFTPEDFDTALVEYQQRQRRYGA